MHVLTPFFEILIIAILLNYILSFIWDTRSRDMVLGLLAFLFIFAISSWFKLPILHKLLLLFGNVAIIAILIIFQPELRMALSKLSLKGRKVREISAFERFLEQLSQSVYRLAEKRLGALVVLQNEDSLDEFTSKAVPLRAQFSSELLESIFATYSPLHDGAVVIKDQSIYAASVILPLQNEGASIPRAMGTRHRAALGLSQTTDAVVIIVSEETAKVSIAREGIITPGVKIDRFKGILRSIFTSPTETRFKTPLRLKEWFGKQ